MSMISCEKCLENDWDFEFIDGWIRATCQFCSFDVEFESKKKRKTVEGYKPQLSEWVWNGSKRNGVEMILAKNQKGHLKYLTREELQNKTTWMALD